jgi:hypothetical protein
MAKIRGSHIDSSLQKIPESPVENGKGFFPFLIEEGFFHFLPKRQALFLEALTAAGRDRRGHLPIAEALRVPWTRVPSKAVGSRERVEIGP